MVALNELLNLSLLWFPWMQMLLLLMMMVMVVVAVMVMLLVPTHRIASRI